MATRKPKYAVLGNLPDDLTEEISSAVEIQLPTSAVEEIDGLFIHGPTASPDLATLEHHLKAGKILTFHQPTDEHLSHMLKLVGYAPASGIPIVSAYRNAADTNSTVFVTLQITYRQEFRTGPDTQYGTDDMGTVTFLGSTNSHLTSAQTVLQNGIPPRRALLPPTAGYTGQQWGTLRVVEALDNATLQLTNPYVPGGVQCDTNWRYASNAQPGTALMYYSDYYVYWANGNDSSGSGPYYCLIRVDGGYVTAGKAGGRIQASYGYFSGLFQLYPVTVTVPSTPSNPPSWTVTSLGSSPGAIPVNSDGTADSNPVNVYAPDLSLTFHGNTPGKTNQDWQWDVGKDSSGQPIPVGVLQIPGWGVNYDFDSSIVFHQVDGWNTYVFPPELADWSVFWTNFVTNGYLGRGVGPALSAGKVPFSQVSSWLIQTPINTTTGGPPQDCVVTMLPSVLADNNPVVGNNTVTLPTLWHYMAFFMHGQAGCSKNHFHGWFNHYYGCYYSGNLPITGDTLDLAAIVNHTASS